MLSKLGESKKGAGLVTSTVVGVGGLVVSVILIFVVLSTITGAGLLTTNSAESNATNKMYGNFTSGIDQISSKLPTVLLITAVVLLFGALVYLFRNTNVFSVAGGSGSL